MTNMISRMNIQLLGDDHIVNNVAVNFITSSRAIKSWIIDCYVISDF